MNTVELASRILTQLGFYQEPSKELGVDDRRDNIVHLIEEYTHPVKEQDESFDRTASHMAGEYVSYKAELTDEEIGDFEHQIIRACGLSTANSDINPIGIRQIIKEILRKAQNK
jgi:hypothetical protein